MLSGGVRTILCGSLSRVEASSGREPTFLLHARRARRQMRRARRQEAGKQSNWLWCPSLRGSLDGRGRAGTAKIMDLEKIREAAERVARSVGMEVVDVEWKVGKERFLRVYIDKPEGPANPSGAGINHRDCEVVSQQLSVILDVEDLVPGPRYTLEISSPGLDRKLYKPADYQRFVGRLARVSLNEGIAVALGAPTNQKFFEGRLAGYANGMVQIDVNGRVIALPFADIRKAHLVVEF